jgi:hypothetical protein
VGDRRQRRRATEQRRLARVAAEQRIFALAQPLGIAASDVYPTVLQLMLSPHHPDSNGYYSACQDASALAETGLEALLAYLLEEMGEETLVELLRAKGSVLLAIARAAVEESPL